MTNGVERLQTPVPGTFFGRYRVVRKLGQGGMGVVYEAEHTDLGKRVALKTLRASLAGDVTLVERFVREGHAAARIRHPNVVDVTDVGTARGVPFLVMELLEGETLAARIRRGPMAPDEVVAVMLPVCAAVAAAHENAVLHRDLKPENIFLERASLTTVRPKVLDFGIAKILDEASPSPSLTHTAAVLGTPFYLSPEQARGARELDARSDQYTLGAILYECSTGRRPFAGASLLAVVAEITAGELRAPRAVRPELTEAFETVVLRAMARDPAARFDSVTALAAALLPFADARTCALWDGAFNPANDSMPALERRPVVSAVRAAPDLVETVGGPRRLVGDRIPAATPRPARRGRAWWRFAGAGVVAATLAAYLIARRTSAPMRAPQAVPVTAVDATRPAVPRTALAAGMDEAAVNGAVPADAADSGVAPAAAARPGRPARRAPAAVRPPVGVPGQRQIPME